MSVNQQQWSDFIIESNKIRELSRLNQNEEARQLVFGISQQHFEEIRKTLFALIDINIHGAKKDGFLVEKNYRSADFWLSIISLMLSLPLTIWLSYKIFIDEY